MVNYDTIRNRYQISHESLTKVTILIDIFLQMFFLHLEYRRFLKLYIKKERIKNVLFKNLTYIVFWGFLKFRANFVINFRKIYADWILILIQI